MAKITAQDEIIRGLHKIAYSCASRRIRDRKCDLDSDYECRSCSYNILRFVENHKEAEFIQTQEDIKVREEVWQVDTMVNIATAYDKQVESEEKGKLLVGILKLIAAAVVIGYPIVAIGTCLGC
jgi:hypothetical protein